MTKSFTLFVKNNKIAWVVKHSEGAGESDMIEYHLVRPIEHRNMKYHKKQIRRKYILLD
jgi:hypothetical protein